MATKTRDRIVTVIDSLARDYLQGKIRTLRLAVIATVCGGHLLLEDIPGLGKTTLALALARTLGLSFGRVQCTSDLLPSDITGLSVFNREENRFQFIPGPVFNNLLLVDEINRAAPRTQSALLEAMEERRVTVEGVTYPLPDPFLVIATQNPVEQVGTYPLPESQLDRFTLTTGLGYPPAEVEKAIIQGGRIREALQRLEPMLTIEEIQQARRAAASVRLADSLVDYIHRVVEATRRHPLILSGISTRGAINLAEASMAAAFLEGRDFVVPEDVQLVAVPVGAHRLLLRPENEGLSKAEVLKSILQELPVPLA
ncbi:MAG: AAA family ATPase [Desulfuromonas sp.]|uniref:AAA family ATPase n=1 Tax=Desulfuromonas sp. TaxID=892 RepID=UPI000CB353D1|nr:MoxR family ATPase [Desulfuromonas sp.]PLX84292.1 MAG: AAA family ATPase [Desulfuromonas sp.]